MPHASTCVVQDEKLARYLLNLGHEQGGPKARFFVSLGFKADDIAEFRAALRAHAAVNPMTNRSSTGFGERYLVTCTLQTPDGRNPCINTVWLAEGSAMPRLITAYPKRPATRRKP